jgi:hypothetical protein
MVSLFFIRIFPPFPALITIFVFFLSIAKTIKLWKVGLGRPIYNLSAVDAFLQTNTLQLPARMKIPNSSLKREDSPRDISTFIRDNSLQKEDFDSDILVYSANTKKTYSDGHAFHINSLAPHSDGEIFFSADDLRINCWNIERPNTCFSK